MGTVLNASNNNLPVPGLHLHCRHPPVLQAAGWHAHRGQGITVHNPAASMADVWAELDKHHRHPALQRPLPPADPELLPPGAVQPAAAVARIADTQPRQVVCGHIPGVVHIYL